MQQPPKSKSLFEHLPESTMQTLARELVQAHRNGKLDLVSLPTAMQFVRQYYIVITQLTFNEKEDKKRSKSPTIREHDVHCNTKYYQGE